MKAYVSGAVWGKLALQACIAVAVIMAGHWYRYRQLDLGDFLCAAVAFLVYLALGAWMAARAAEKNGAAVRMVAGLDRAK